MGRAWTAWRGQSVLVRDGALAAVLLVALTAAAVSRDVSDIVPLVAVLVVVGTASVTWRRRAPLVAVAVSGAALVGAAFVVGAGSGALTGVIVAVYSAIAWGRRLLGTVAAVVVVVGESVAAFVRGGAWAPDDVLLTGFVLAVTVATGLAVQSRRAAVDTARERAERAEQTREVEAARRVAEERLRIARELHDVLGHHVAVIGVQSGVAETLLTRNPDAAREALQHVQDASQTALAELGALVQVLREAGDDPLAGPAPGLAGLADLLDEARATGLVVHATVSGAARELAPVVDLAAYRVVQEALTNAHKHGVGPADVALTYGEDVLVVVVGNAVAVPQAGHPAGYGLVGMRERVTSVGGTLVTGPHGERFDVRATLPVLPALVEASGREAP